VIWPDGSWIVGHPEIENSGPQCCSVSDNMRLVGDVRRETLGPAQEKIGALEALDEDIVWG
jgi:hypothetical protein